MHGARQLGHAADHTHLRRVLARKHQAREDAASLVEARSPQRIKDWLEDLFNGPGRGGGRGGGGRDDDDDRGPGRGGNSNNGGGNGNGNNNGGGGGGGPGRGDNNGGGNNPQPTPTPTPTQPAQPTQTQTPVVSNTPAPNQPAPSDNNGNDGNNNNGNNGGGRDDDDRDRSSSTQRDPNGGASSDSAETATGSSTTGATTLGRGDATPSTNTAPAVVNVSAESSLGPPSSTGTTLPVTATGAAKQGLSGALIAGIVVICLLVFLLLFALLVRRRWVSRRRDRMQRWWFTRKRNSKTYDDKTVPYPEYSEKTLPATPASTTFAQAATLAPGSTYYMDAPPSPLDLTNIVPTAPPLAEVRAHHGSGHHNQMDSDRFSIGSASSDGSDGSHFIVHHPVKRQSERESFKFPKPPSISPEAFSIHSRSGSGNSQASSLAVAYHSGGSVSSLAVNKAPMAPSALSRPPITPSAMPTPAPLTIKTKPSNDKIPNPFFDPSEPSATIPNPFPTNPFGDEQALAAVGNFAAIETIRRFYQPTLADELLVNIGDSVRVLEIFDDGWAMVEKVVMDDPKGKAPERDVESGLIPIACLRDATQDLSTFLNTKRVQSFQVSSQTTD